MADFSPLPPDSQTEFVAPGDVTWRDWFIRLRDFLQGVTKQKDPWKVGSIPYVTNDDGKLTTNSTLTVTALEAVVAGGGVSYVPLAVGTEPLEFVSDGAGQPVLIPYTP